MNFVIRSKDTRPVNGLRWILQLGCFQWRQFPKRLTDFKDNVSPKKIRGRTGGIGHRIHPANVAACKFRAARPARMYCGQNGEISTNQFGKLPYFTTGVFPIVSIVILNFIKEARDDILSRSKSGSAALRNPHSSQ
jgi:hypothetical protein